MLVTAMHTPLRYNNDDGDKKKSYDIDRSNTIETDEFIDFMTQEFLASAPPPPGQICEASSEHLWEIPR